MDFRSKQTLCGHGQQKRFLPAQIGPLTIKKQICRLATLCHLGLTNIFYRATACNATHDIAVAVLSVRPSVRRFVCPSDACIVTIK